MDNDITDAQVEQLLRSMLLNTKELDIAKTDPCSAANGSYQTDDNQTSHVNCSDIINLFTENVTNTFVQAHLGSPLGRDFFTYVTPVIFTIGMVGNILSLRVFLTKNMRKLSASAYLAALSVADIMALCFYVSTEWVRRGLSNSPGESAAPFLEQNGVCQILLYFQYIARFLCSWLVVCFTLERYIGVCHPLKRKDICDVRSSRKIVLVLVVIAYIFCAFKPWLSEVIEVGYYKVPFCTRSSKHPMMSFVLDCVFVISNTFLPFVIITILNALIIRKLFIRNKRHRECKIVTEESIIRLEFTFILIAISFCFIAFNVPFSVVWFKTFLLSNKSLFTEASSAQNLQEFNQVPNLLFFTRTIYYMNYCVNFFLYSVTGAYFRKELQMLFTYKSKAYQNYQTYHRCSLRNTNTNSNTPQSWL